MYTSHEKREKMLSDSGDHIRSDRCRAALSILQAQGKSITAHQTVCEILAIEIEESFGGRRLGQRQIDKLLSDYEANGGHVGPARRRGRKRQ
jgi:hypothetical protein